MNFTDYLFDEVREIWEGYLNHPFIKEIGEGILDKSKFKNYLIQDYLYLKEYAKVFCVGVVKARTMKEMKFYYNSIKGTMEDETAVHIRYLADFGITPEETENSPYNIITSSYTSYMQGIALTGDLKEIAMAVMPCTWSYNYIGNKLKEKYVHSLNDNFYKDWIDVYGSEGFDKFTNEWIDYINELCKEVTDDEKKKLADIFIKSSIYEMQFWDMAYKEVKES